MAKIFFKSFFLVPAYILFFALSSPQAHSRWAEKTEANIECLKSDSVYKVNKDGTWTMETEIQLKVLTEAGRQALSTQTYTYDATTSTLQVIEAKTNSNGEEAIVPKEKIEDKPLASDPLGLCEKHQILIPFECVTVGSTIYVKAKQHFFKPPFESYFANHLTFSSGYLWTQHKTTIESELPLFWKANDPRNNLDIRETKDKSKHTLQVTLKRPILEQLTGESKHSYGEPALYTSVIVSTEKDYQRIGKLEAQFYQRVLTAPLPKDLERIRDIASKSKSEVDCIDTIVAHLIEKISYLGSWNIAEGHLAPRSLETIITSGYGDCKEYSACLTAILKSLGYHADIAVVHRGEAYLEERTLPNHSEFDHAIVKVVSPSGKTYWIDPTNVVSMAEGIFPDIADRPTLVLNPDNPTYERIPAINHQDATNNLEQTIIITESGHIQREGCFCFKGEAAKGLTECLNTHQLSLVKEALINSLCEGSDPIDPMITFSKGVSRKVKPLNVAFRYGENHITTHTNLGNAFPITSNWYKPYVAVSQKDEGALYVGHPETFVKKTLFKGLSAQQLDKLAFMIQTPWLNAKRELLATEEGVVVTETIEILKSIISAKELKSSEYGKLKDTLRKYCDGVAIIFSK